MKLLSGHEVCELSKEELERQEDFKGYSNSGVLTLKPENWFFPKSFTKFADKYYQFEFRPEDVLVMTFPKCGTTWTQEIVWTVINNPNLDHPLQDTTLSARSPFIEFDFLLDDLMKAPDSDYAKLLQKFCPGKDPKDGVSLQIAESMEGCRVLKTHLPFSLINPNALDKCKVIYVVRDPKDVCVSFLHHSRLLKVHNYQGSLDHFVDLFVDDKLMFSPFWETVREAWEKRSHPNLHFIYYEDLKANPEKEIRDICQFLGRSLNDTQIKNVVERTSFSSMKNFSEKDAQANMCVADSVVNLEFAKKEGSFFRKGEVGDFKNKLTPEMRTRIDEWTNKNAAGMGIKYCN